ncbi:hypothetical protein MKZ38_010721 [Zalerion maritima]|uniref:Wbp11/ELF5/Saf1 N-terminal domain-containing protein n=1 Tax=Zalerion maritima TaxID=339359 RepID=A0AAD5WMT8_9PEZI|nr:hypothetical protein MKZ38_010721 [Zalerion maritima]
MPKERNFNPVQTQRKADKKKEIKKGKAELQARRNEKLAKRNPERIQKQIDDLKKITSTGGKLSKHEESVLEGLERELKSVTKARETLGDKAPEFSSRGQGYGGREGGALGKRSRHYLSSDDNDSDVPEDVKRIPMPRDTPPPIPKEVMDAWHARRRSRWQARQQERAEEEEVAEGLDGGERKKPKPVVPVESKTVYESKPQVRDLKKEAVTAFVPAAVRMKMEKVKGQGGLMEPEEADRLEREGYLNKTATTVTGNQVGSGPKQVTLEEVEDDKD